LQVQCGLAARSGLAFTYLGIGLGKFRVGAGALGAAVPQPYVVISPLHLSRYCSTQTGREIRDWEKKEEGQEEKWCSGAHACSAELRPIWPGGRPRWRSGSGGNEEDRGGEVLTRIEIACCHVPGRPAADGPPGRMWPVDLRTRALNY